MARWQKRERIGEVVSLVGKFVALGKLAGTVYDGQDIKHEWDIENNVSFSLMKRVESEFYEDVWLYNRFVFNPVISTPPRSNLNFLRVSAQIFKIPFKYISLLLQITFLHYCIFQW